MKFKKVIGAVIGVLALLRATAQDADLDKMLDDEMNKKKKQETEHTAATFKTTMLINGQTVESTQAGILDFKISHRFGTLNSGAYNFFGLDNASIRLGLNYGISNRLSIGIGRSSFEKQFDGFLKYRLLWQSMGKKNIPVSVTLLSSVMLKTIKDSMEIRVDSITSKKVKLNFSDRFYYAFQVLIARKFNEAFSLQVMPTMIHYNIVPTSDIKNDFYALGIGGRMKITKRTSIIAEYYYVFPGNNLPKMYNSFSLGYEIETGGHVFQLNFTNSRGMTERTFITETTGRWSKGDIYFGFNVSRVFTLKHTKEQKW